MASSDIYEVKESPWEKKTETKEPVSQRRRHRKYRGKTFDEAVDRNLGATHRRRSRNSGSRRFRHLMKNPTFAKRFWIGTLGGAGLILVLLVVWDYYFRYPKSTPTRTQGTVRSSTP